MGSSRTRARTCVPCIGRRILNHCTTREALDLLFKARILSLAASSCYLSHTRSFSYQWLYFPFIEIYLLISQIIFLSFFLKYSVSTLLRSFLYICDHFRCTFSSLQIVVLSLVFLKINLFILFYLVLAALGLCCCVRFFSSCSEWGLPFVALRGLLIVVASPCCRAQALGAQDSVTVACGLSSCGTRALERGLSSCGTRA